MPDSPLGAPILSAEGALAALISVVAGEPIALELGATLGLIALGIGLAAAARGEQDELAVHDDRRAALCALAGALAFGASLYATAAWARRCRSPGSCCLPGSWASW